MPNSECTSPKSSRRSGKTTKIALKTVLAAPFTSSSRPNALLKRNGNERK